MALPRYQNIGVAAGAGIGAIDFPNRGEATRGFDALSTAMNTMSEAFFGEARIAATEEGERYGAEKAPTQEQLRQAIETGQPLQPVADTRTYFGKAANKAYSELLIQQINYSARGDIDRIQRDATEGRIRVAEIVPKMNALIAGYSSAIRDVDPVLARKTEALLAYEGNSAYLAATKAIASKAADAAKTETVISAADLINNIQTDFRSGDVQEGEQGPLLPISEKLKIRQQQFEQSISRLPPSMAKPLVDKFNNEVISQQKDFVTSWVLSGATPEERLTRSQSIDEFFAKKRIDERLDPTGEVTRVMRDMDTKEIRDTRKMTSDAIELRNREDERLVKRTLDAQTETQTRSYEDLIFRIETARRSGGQGMPTVEDVMNLNLPVTGNDGVNKQALLDRIRQVEFGPVKRDNAVFADMYERAALPPDDPRRLDPRMIREAVAARRIDVADEAKLLKVLQNTGTPQGRAEEQAKKTFLRAARNTIERKDFQTGLVDPMSAENYVAFEQEFLSEFERRKAAGESVSDLLDVRNPKSLWPSVKNYQRTAQEILRDQVDALKRTQAPKGNIPARQPGESIADWKKRTNQ
jgi:hypothetical protein